MVEIKVTTWEMMSAALVGVMRQIEDLRAGRRHRWGHAFVPAWQNNIEAAISEFAVAKHLGVFWPGKGKIKDPDLGDNIEVRHSGKHDNSLIIRDGDNPESIFYFVTGLYGEYRIRGKIKGADAMKFPQTCPTNDDNYAWFIPPEKLIPIVIG